MNLKSINYLFLLLLISCQAPRYDSSSSVSSLVYERLQLVEEEACLSLNDPLDARSSVFISLAHNPQVRYNMAWLSLAEADMEAASTIANPAFQFLYGFPEGGKGQNSIDAVLLESVISLCLRPARIEAARAGLYSAQWGASHEILSMAIDMEASFYQLKAQELLTSLHQERYELLQKMQEIETERFKEGGSEPSVLLETKKLAFQAKDEWLLSKAQEAEARQAFEQLLGVSCGYSLIGDLPYPEPTECLEGIEETILSSRADVQALRWELQSIISSAPTASWWAQTDLGLGIGFEKDSEGDITLGPLIEGELPLFDRGQAERARLCALYQQTREKLYSLEQSVLAELKANKELLVLHQQRATLYNEELLPLQQSLLQNAEDSYEVRAVDQKEHVNTQLELLDIKEKSLEATRDYWLAKIALKKSLSS